jgi:hypothetical protein
VSSLAHDGDVAPTGILTVCSSAKTEGIEKIPATLTVSNKNNRTDEEFTVTIRPISH